MELAFSIDRDGLVEDTHAVVYKQLGAWVRTCYGSPLQMTTGVGASFSLRLRKGDVFDRFQLTEDIVMGQRVRSYRIDMESGGSSAVTLLSGDAIGQKRIHLLPQPVSVSTEEATLTLHISEAVAPAHIKSFGVYRPCTDGNSTR